MTNERLNELPFPARHLVDMDSYHYTIDGVRSLSLIAQLGCPFCCTFCGGRESPMLRRIRTRTTENIIDEVRHLHRDYGAKGFMFYDDELNVNPNMIGLMDGLRRAQDEVGVEFKMRGFIKSQLFTDAQASAMHGAGFRWILVGFESGSERILTNIKKKATRDENTRCMEIADRHGLKVKALMSLGHAGESADTVDATEQWLLEVKPDDFDATVISVYAGTPYHDWAVQTSANVWTYTSENGDRLHSFEMDYAEEAGYYKGRVGEYQSHVFTDFLKPEQLVKLRDRLETSVRAKLGIPFNQSAASIQYEHSMGQAGALPGHILRKTA
jgi:tRNA A37 methylthiotransferase MiaB